jgi:cell division protein FtsI/penicillin-binding protein 2
MKSSNIGAAKIGIKLGEDHLYDYIRAFGFGEKSEITLGGEVRGKVHPVREWDKLMISRIPMGHSVSVTPLQITMAMCAIANDGKLMRPMLVKRMQEPTGDVCAEYEPQVVRQVVRPETARTMVEALKTVATKDGTALKARMDHYTVAGKTGTARKVVGRVYSPTKYISSFIGFFPADDPQICISVIFDEPNHGFYGGQVAAPVFRKIAEQVANYLKIKPDPEEPPPGTEVSLETLRTAGIATQAP